MPNFVFIGTSLDGYIADRNGNLDFLQTVPNPDKNDFGFSAFMDRIDAVLMGRKTLETVLSFGCDWHYTKPVFVLSSTMKSLPPEMEGKVEIVTGNIKDILAALNSRGFETLYIDGGQLIQSFLKLDLIDELIITQIPVLLGGGTPLFGALSDHLEFEHLGIEVMLNALVKNSYRRVR